MGVLSGGAGGGYTRHTNEAGRAREWGEGGCTAKKIRDDQKCTIKMKSIGQISGIYRFFDVGSYAEPNYYRCVECIATNTSDLDLLTMTFANRTEQFYSSLRWHESKKNKSMDFSNFLKRYNSQMCSVAPAVDYSNRHKSIKTHRVSKRTTRERYYTMAYIILKSFFLRYTSRVKCSK